MPMIAADRLRADRSGQDAGLAVAGLLARVPVWCIAAYCGPSPRRSRRARDSCACQYKRFEAMQLVDRSWRCTVQLTSNDERANPCRADGCASAAGKAPGLGEHWVTSSLGSRLKP
jgi:hypothetical protein